MQNILSITATNGYETILLYSISFISIFLGIYTIINKNPILSILFLIGLFFSVSIYLILIGLHFIGLSYLLVYVGAVSILFLFIVMLINIRSSELLTDNRNSIPLAVIAVLSINYCIDGSLPYNIYTYNIVNMLSLSSLTNAYHNIASTKISGMTNDMISSVLSYMSSFNVSGVFSKSWDTILITSSHISSIGSLLYTNLFILFIITSLILLLALIGAITITMNKHSSIKSYQITETH